jgi:Nif-specific regulatory protein
MAPNLNDLEGKVLCEISQIIGQALELDQALEAVLAILSESLAMQWGAVLLKDSETGQLRLRAQHGRDAAGQPPPIDPWDDELAGLIFGAAQPYAMAKARREPLFLKQRAAQDLQRGQISFLAAPVILQGAPLGVVTVDRLYGDAIAWEEDLRFLSLVAGLIGQFVSLHVAVQAREELLRQENLALRAALLEKSPQLVMVGKSPAIAAARQMIKKVAPIRAAVLLLGEPGTGRTLMARIIHSLSPRAPYPFVKIHCASLPENLLEAEIFGLEQGGPSGAARAKPGRLEEADGGTIFLDEVEKVPLPLQAKVGRFLQEREFQRLGGTKTRKVDVRIIAATARELTKRVRAGAFLEELHDLLKVFSIRAPALRSRREDIPPLLDHFLNKVSQEYGRRFYFTQRAQAVLEEYNWPGNVGEMENLVERLAIMVEGAQIEVKDLPAYLAPAGTKAKLEDQAFLSRLKEMERREIVAALERNHWIQSQAAMDLGLTLRQIGYRVKQFGLDRLIKAQRGQGAGARLKGLEPR